MFAIEIIKVIIFGIVEGFTEWLPISSTGHLILVENLIPLSQPEEFWNVFKVVIQLGAILACVLLYWDRLWPFSRTKTIKEKLACWDIWKKVIISSIPAALAGFLLNDLVDEYLSTPTVIATTLILYGIIFILMENLNKKRSFAIKNIRMMSIRTASMIGLFQCLSLIPGTSRSGATILGAMFLGCTRGLSAEFSFFLGIPIMFGASLLKVLKYGLDFTFEQLFILILGTLVSFIMAVYSIRFLMRYIKRHDFTAFGYYRIVLGVIVLICFHVQRHGF